MSLHIQIIKGSSPAVVLDIKLIYIHKWMWVFNLHPSQRRNITLPSTLGRERVVRALSQGKVGSLQYSLPLSPNHSTEGAIGDDGREWLNREARKKDSIISGSSFFFLIAGPWNSDQRPFQASCSNLQTHRIENPVSLHLLYVRLERQPNLQHQRPRHKLGTCHSQSRPQRLLRTPLGQENIPRWGQGAERGKAARTGLALLYKQAHHSRQGLWETQTTHLRHLFPAAIWVMPERILNVSLAGLLPVGEKNTIEVKSSHVNLR